MKKKNPEITFDKKLWYKVRYYQQLYNISNQQLASYIGVSPRTLTEYDKNPSNVTLGRITCFLQAMDIEIEALLTL